MTDDAAVVFANIARELAAQQNEQGVLDRVVELAVQLLPGCDDAGIVLIQRQQEVRTAARTSERVRISDELQARLHQGPCFDAATDSRPWQNQFYRCTNTATDPRWPDYLPAARQLGVGSMLGYQLYREEHRFGALDLYSNEPEALDETTERLGWVLASHAAVAINTARTTEQLYHALETREEIGQAVGRLMQRYQLSAADGFSVLQRISNDNNIKLRDIAAKVAATGELPGQEQE